MPLSEEEFTAIVDRGCPHCKGAHLELEALVVQRMPLLEGEPYGSPSWGYKGEDLVRGTFRIACDGCKAELYAATGWRNRMPTASRCNRRWSMPACTCRTCPRCDATDGVARALDTENALPLPTGCTGCGSKLVTATAYVPAVVTYEGKRANKARTQTAPEDPGFHTVRVECKECKKVGELRDPCPLCGGAPD